MRCGADGPGLMNDGDLASASYGGGPDGPKPTPLDGARRIQASASCFGCDAALLFELYRK